MIKSDKDFVSGQPAIEGYERSVCHVVAEVNCLGLEGYTNELDSDAVDERIGDKIKEAIDYCRNEQCVPDKRDGNLVRYCEACTKGGGKFKVWNTAQMLYEGYYKIISDF